MSSRIFLFSHLIGVVGNPLIPRFCRKLHTKMTALIFPVIQFFRMVYVNVPLFNVQLCMRIIIIIIVIAGWDECIKSKKQKKNKILSSMLTVDIFLRKLFLILAATYK